MTLALLEGSSRLLNLAPQVHQLRPGNIRSAYRVSDNPILGYVFKDSYRDAQPDLHQSFSSTNAQGMRDVERTVEKLPGVRRVEALLPATDLESIIPEIRFFSKSEPDV